MMKILYDSENVMSKTRKKKKAGFSWRGKTKRTNNVLDEDDHITFDIDAKRQLHYIPAMLMVVDRGQGDRLDITPILEEKFHFEVNGKELIVKRMVEDQFTTKMDEDIKLVQCWGRKQCNENTNLDY